MSFLRKRNIAEVLRVTHPDDPESWIELKAEFSKGEINGLGMAAPSGEEDREGALNFLESFFEVAVVDWSLTDDNGEKIKPSRAAYRDLSLDAGQWVDEVLGNHISQTIGKEVEEAEGKRKGSPRS